MKEFLKKVFLKKSLVRRMVRYVCYCKNRNGIVALVIRHFLLGKYHIGVGDDAKIGSGIIMPHLHNIIIGNGAIVGNNCTIYHDVTLGQNQSLYPRLGDNVIVYTGAKVIGGIVVGDNAIIGANAIVVKDVPEGAIVAGNPAKVVGCRDPKKNYF